MTHQRKIVLQCSLALLALLACGLAAMSAVAQTLPPPAPGPVVVPQVERRELGIPRVPSKDIELGVFGGLYSVENFGSNGVGGLRVGYHLSEDFFVEAGLAQAKLSDEDFRKVLPGGFFGNKKQQIRYAVATVGWNVLPGEIFLGGSRAKISALYLAGGAGTTRFVDQRRQTFAFGLGLRVLLADRWAMRVDLRDHVYKVDLTGTPQSTHNPELTAGLSYFF